MAGIIQRDRYLQKLIDRRENGQIKVITGIRRCGKSFLLFNLYYDWLISQGVSPEQITTIALDDDRYLSCRDPSVLSETIRGQIRNREMYYVFLDEVPSAIRYEELRIRLYNVLNGLIRLRNVDIYVTGSNSRPLTKDVMTAFRGRGDEERVYPLSFGENHAFLRGEKQENYEEYALYGGMPLNVFKKTDAEKTVYLKNLFQEIYFRNIVERYHVELPDVLEDLTDDLCSSVGSLTNARRIARTLKSVRGEPVSSATIPYI